LLTICNVKKIDKGISELLAIVIGIAITIAIGVAFYTFVPNFVNTFIQQQKVGVVVTSTSVIDKNTAIATISVRNLGTRDIYALSIMIVTNRSINLELLSPTPSTTSNGKIDIDLRNSILSPGQEIPLIIRLSTHDDGPLIGTKVGFIITAKFADNVYASESLALTII